jgi:N-succinyldiaminopimelate aminotransferase
MPTDPISAKLAPFGTTIFATMTALAEKHGAINLSQGFPDFEGPSEVIEAAVDALRSGENQYARPQGHPRLVEAITDRIHHFYGLDYDPYSEVVVTSGATEAITGALLGLLNPGDEVVVFEPFYDSYPAAIAMAGARPRYATLRFPDFVVDFDHLASLFNSKTRVLLLNSPHNPTGKVFSEEELLSIGRLCEEHDVVILSDEVYEHLTFDGARHVPPASVGDLRQRTVSVHSSGKTFSLTGWKIGWAVAPAALAAAVQAAHQFITFATATPLQVAVASALTEEREEYVKRFQSEYAARRQQLVEALVEVGFDVAVPQGTYFALADFSRLWRGDDQGFALHLVREVGVAAIPPSVFYNARPEEGRKRLRFSFAKRLETLSAAAKRLRKLEPLAP